MFGSFEEPKCKILTTAILSEQNSTRVKTHRLLYDSCTATTPGKNPVEAMDKDLLVEDHVPTKQLNVKDGSISLCTSCVR